MPYIDRNKKYTVSENIKTTTQWKVAKDFEPWKFNTSYTNEIIIGSLFLNGTSQPVLFHQQKEALPITNVC